MSLPADANLVLRLDDTSNLWKDTARTQSATANNDAVQAWDDASGNGYNATLVSGATQGTLKTATYGARSVSASSTALTFGQPAGLVSVFNSGTTWTVFAFLKPSLMSTQPYVFTKASGGGARLALALIPQGTPSLPNWGQFGQSSGGCHSPGYDALTPHSYAYATYPSEGVLNQRVYVAGAPVTSRNAALPSTDTTNDIILGGFAGGSTFRFTGDLLALYCYSRTLSPAEVLTLSDYCYSHWSIANPRAAAPYTLIFSGNSLFTHLAGNPSIPEKLRETLGLPLGSVFNIAVGGQTSAQMSTDDATRLDGLLSALSGSNPLVCGWECGNSQNTTDYNTWATGRKSAGWPRVMVGTVPPRTTGGFNATRNTQNPTIRTNAASNGYFIADVAADPTIGIDAAASDTGLYGDGVHFTEWGSRYAWAVWERAIRQVMGGLGRSAGIRTGGRR
jgi:hypothetical protein